MVFYVSQLSEGISLNSVLHVDHKLQEEVLMLMIRWAFLPFVFSCDVVKMFRQFLVTDTDWHYIIWRDSSDESMQSFRLITVTYGTACAPFLANACMLQLADDQEKLHPIAAEVLRKNRYADDFFAGGDTLAEARSVREPLVQALASAGMSVGKWASNCPEFLSDLDDQTERSHEVMIQQQATVSTLELR